jgi:hypothetical protein
MSAAVLRGGERELNYLRWDGIAKNEVGHRMDMQALKAATDMLWELLSIIIADALCVPRDHKLATPAAWSGNC